MTRVRPRISCHVCTSHGARGRAGEHTHTALSCLCLELTPAYIRQTACHGTGARGRVATAAEFSLDTEAARKGAPAVTRSSSARRRSSLTLTPVVTGDSAPARSRSVKRSVHSPKSSSGSSSRSSATCSSASRSAFTECTAAKLTSPSSRSPLLSSKLTRRS
jgi:hypothetical protein